MNTEEKLKDYILSRYNSLRDFSIRAEIPHTTFVSILKRGIQNANVGNVIKICRELNISADELADGKIVLRERQKP